METYTLKNLLEDKQLRAAVVKEEFSFTDGNGVVTCLDFKNATMLKNHRALYDLLYELGGEELLGKLLAGGNTCLTDDPGAAKAGVRGIRGTDKYFLLTNAGDPKVLASILWGIQGLSEALEDFDPEAVCLTVGEDGEAEDEETDEEAEEEECLPAYDNVSLVQKDGKYVFYDNDAKEFITLKSKNLPDGELAGMLECEPLEIPACRGDQCDSSDGEEIRMGWKYKLSEYGAWGWISEDCTVVSEPIFKKLEVRCDGRTYARSEMSLLGWSEVGIIGLYVSSDGREPLERKFGMGMNGIPESGVSYTEGLTCRLAAWTEEDGTRCGRVNYLGEDDYAVSFRDGVLKIWKATFGGDVRPELWMSAELTVHHCEQCFGGREERKNRGLWNESSLKKSEYEDLCLLLDETRQDAGWGKQGSLYYALRREDGYYGIVEADGYGTVKKICAPYAFTHICGLNRERGLAAVERFGKWGVYDVREDRYVVPCDYESVRWNDFGNTIRVARMNFKGEVRCDGTWAKHLQREEG